MYRAITLVLLLGLAVLPALAAGPVLEPGNARYLLTLPGALGADQSLVLKLEVCDGAVTRATSVPTATVDAAGLKLADGALTGEAKAQFGATALTYTLDVKIDGAKATGAFTGKAGDVDVKGAVTGTLVPLLAPYGSKSFYPTPERPVGFRGDGNGWFPGATPVREFADGTPAKVTLKVKDRSGKLVDGQSWGFADDTAKNIVWKTEMPAWGNTQPIVVGDRVFVLGEMNAVICVDANTGKVLWTREPNPWELNGMDKDKAAKLMEMARIYDIIQQYDRAFFASRDSRPAEVAKGWATACVDGALPRMLEALETLDPALDLSAPAKAAADALAKVTENESAAQKAMGTLKSTLSRRILAFGGIKVQLDSPWGNMIGFNMNAMVSDGQYVYASMGMGMAVCYDLDGNLVWGKYIVPSGNNTHYCNSPLLAGDIMIDINGGTDKIRGLDKKTGEIKWEAPNKGDYAFGKASGYYVGGHKVVHLENAKGESLDVIVTSLCNIIRAKDGKVLGALPYEFGPSGGPSIFSVGDIVFKSTNGDNLSTPLVAFRLTLVDEDTVKVEKLWQTAEKSSPGYHGQIATDSRIIITSRAGNVLDAQTGKVLVPGGKNGVGDLSNVLAGNTMFWISGNSWDPLMSGWGGRRADGWAMRMIFAADLADPQKPKRLTTTGLLGTKAKPRMPALEKYAPELYARDDYWSQWGGMPSHFLHLDTGIFPAGNRLFIRSVGHLYCIGDPAVPYDWNPESRPKAITDQLAAAKAGGVKE